MLSSGKHRALTVLSTLQVLKSPLELQDEAVLAVTPNGSLYNPLAPSQKVTLPGGLSVGWR